MLQGLAAGLMLPAGQGLIGSIASREQLGRIFGFLGLVIALGPAVGPGIGGFLIESTNWRSVFWINVPVGVMMLWLAHRIVPRGERRIDHPIDLIGFGLLSAGLPALLYGAYKLGSRIYTLPDIAAGLGGIALTIIFTIRALRQSNPLVDLRLFQIRPFTFSCLTTAFAGANMFAGLLVLPMYLLSAHAQSSSEVGMFLFAMGLGSALALPVAGALTDRFGARRMVVSGALLLLATTIPFVLLETLSPPLLTIILVVRGVGLGITQMPATTAAYTSITAQHMADAATLVNIVQRLGGAIGAAAMAMMLTTETPNASYAVPFATLIGLSILTLVMGVALPDRLIKNKT